MNNLSVIEEYRVKVAKLVLIVIVLSISAAALVFPAMKFLNLYPTVSWQTMIVFEIIFWLEAVAGIILVKTAIVDGKLSEKKEKIIKLWLFIVVTININVITWFFPSKESWNFLFYFMILMSLFLDVKFIVRCCLVNVLSVIIVHIFNPMVLPVEELFITDLILRVICLSLSLFGLLLFVYFVSHILLNTKKDELEKNRNKTAQVIEKATSLADRLAESSKILMENSHNKSSTTEQLSAISETLYQNSSRVMEESKKGQENLMVLNDSSMDMTNKMQEVGKVSGELTEISESNEMALNDLMVISEKVENSTKHTADVTEKLLIETEAIGQTLDVINDIAESINLLSLNASIEAARAGELGRGFGVVAMEVGRLAANTKDSLNDVNNVITKLKKETRTVANFMNENATQLMEQNTVLNNTVNGIRKMIELLKVVGKNIAIVGQLQTEQQHVIAKTVTLNEGITDSISAQYDDFGNITDLVHTNRDDLDSLVIQIDNLNEMVGELEELLVTVK